MRTCDTLYARQLRPEQHRELLAELNHYRLFDLEKLIREEFLDRDHRETINDLVIVLSDHQQFIARLLFPLLVILLPTFKCLKSAVTNDQLNKLFNRSLYDVRIFPELYEGNPFSGGSTNANQMVLYPQYRPGLMIGH